MYDTAGNLIATRTGLAGFIGIASTIPIGRIEMDENSGGDDVGFTGLDIVDCTSPAAVRYPTNAGDWQHDADRLATPEGLPASTFTITPASIVEAEEVTQTPGDSVAVGPVLTFSTFIPDCSLHTLQAGAEFVMNDTGFSTLNRPLLGIGRVDAHQDDDFAVNVGGCTPAVGYVLHDTPSVVDEYVLVFAGAGKLLGMFAGISSATDTSPGSSTNWPSTIAYSPRRDRRTFRDGVMPSRLRRQRLRRYRRLRRLRVRVPGRR